MNELPERHLINAEIMTATARQIEKDLGLDKLDIENFSNGTKPFEQLYSALLPEVENIMSQNPSSLPQHLYQVDLPENLVNAALASDYPVRLLTEYIIKRCFQKVVLRQVYRSGKI